MMVIPPGTTCSVQNTLEMLNQCTITDLQKEFNQNSSFMTATTPRERGRYDLFCPDTLEMLNQCMITDLQKEFNQNSAFMTATTPRERGRYDLFRPELAGNVKPVYDH